MTKKIRVAYPARAREIEREIKDNLSQRYIVVRKNEERNYVRRYLYDITITVKKGRIAK